MSPRKVLLLSNSKQHGESVLEWCSDQIKSFLKKSGVTKVLFVPYAVTEHAECFNKFNTAFNKMELQLESIHEKPDPVAAVNECEAIYISGGNTFLLLKTLYEKKLIEAIRHNVLIRGVPYIGASAGSNVATRSINTTNDMPICYPPSFDALKLVPFNINPHYVDPDPNSKHMGETREMRISEYHEQPICFDVLGLREASGLVVEDMKATLVGLSSARLFQKGLDPVNVESGADLSFLLNDDSC